MCSTFASVSRTSKTAIIFAFLFFYGRYVLFDAFVSPTVLLSGVWPFPRTILFEINGAGRKKSQKAHFPCHPHWWIESMYFSKSNGSDGSDLPNTWSKKRHPKILILSHIFISAAPLSPLLVLATARSSHSAIGFSYWLQVFTFGCRGMLKVLSKNCSQHTQTPQLFLYEYIHTIAAHFFTSRPVLAYLSLPFYNLKPNFFFSEDGMMCWLINRWL